MANRLFSHRMLRASSANALRGFGKERQYLARDAASAVESWDGCQATATLGLLPDVVFERAGAAA